MCDPISATAAALTAGGMYVSSKREASNQKAMQQARESTAEAERIRQKGYAAENAPIFDASLAANTRSAQDASLDQLQDQRATATAANVSDAPAYAAPIGGATSEVVKGEIARRMSDSIAKARAQAREMGSLNAWGNLQSQNQIGANQAGQQMQTINQKSRSSLALLPAEQAAAANNANKGPSNFGQLLQLGGTALGLGAGLGAFDGTAFSSFNGLADSAQHLAKPTFIGPFAPVF